ncbi:MAG: GNAT family N-acetyltransferase, partial [Ruminococcus sp.]|nr:GNAT family N-acetyltransferase [Ruminococcus sp.]
QGIATRLVNEAMAALKKLGINKTALVVFSKNESGNAFWEKSGFTERTDLVYRNKAITEMVRIDT